MAHQINLLGDQGERPSAPPGSKAGLVAIAISIGVVMALGLVLNELGARAAAQVSAGEQALASLQAQVATARSAQPSGETAELARLRAQVEGQRRTRAALDPGHGAAPRGYSGYLVALSQQSSATLWLTGFSVAPDGISLEIDGRMTDPHQLPVYLRRLDAEPLFSGREFAQLSLKTVAPGTIGEAGAVASGYVEFALRSTAAGQETR